MDSDRTDYMAQALIEAKQAGKNGEVPVGAVIVNRKTGEIISATSNRVEIDHDPCAHAEILAIRKACEILGGTRLPDCDMYVTLEPCPMCATAISFARIKTLYFGAYDPKGGGVDHGPEIFKQTTCHHKPEVYGGIREQESASLLKEFFQKLR